MGRSRGADSRVAARSPYTEAITHFARALGAARSGQPGGGQRRHRAARGAARHADQAAKDAYWAEQVEISARSRRVDRFAEGRKDEGLAS